jgi:predicted SAM-dependent methyltransferase
VASATFPLHEAKPDIQGTISNMTMVASASVDAIYSAHNIEHLYAHEVPVAMREFYRVLKAISGDQTGHVKAW